VNLFFTLPSLSVNVNVGVPTSLISSCIYSFVFLLAHKWHANQMFIVIGSVV
jgi:hypothetical protein